MGVDKVADMNDKDKCKTKTMTMTMTVEFREYLQRAIFDPFDL